MGKIKQINIKNRTYYFYTDMIIIKDFVSSLLKLDKKSFKNIAIYYTGYITRKDKYKLIVYILFIYLFMKHMASLKKKKEINT